MSVTHPEPIPPQRRARPPRAHARKRRTALVAGLAAGAALIALVGFGPLSPQPGKAAAASAKQAGQAMSPMDVADRGAKVPFTEMEAESADHTGKLIGPDRTYTKLPSEASGRQAVQLSSAGDYVEFTLTKAANAMSLRYALPDDSDGTGITSPAKITVNGKAADDLSLTSKYSWFYGDYPWTNTPGKNPHHFYDDARMMFGKTLPEGTKVRIAKPDDAKADWYAVDLADFEQVDDPIAKPEGALSVNDFGADDTGGKDSTDAFQKAVDEGKSSGKEVYIPKGKYTLYGHVTVDGVTLRGAGPWYSELTGQDPQDSSRAVGVFGKSADDGGSKNVKLKDFAIIGNVTERVDANQVNAIGGALNDSTVDDVWLQHTKVGAWMDGPMEDFHLTNSRILDQTADGVNFHKGVTGSSVENTFVRNTGDDGLAMWADTKTNSDDSFKHNTVVAPVLANNIAIYGGKDIEVSDNVAAESITNGGGLHVGNRFDGVEPGSTGVAGTFTLARNTLIRTGNKDDGWQFPIGALWFDARNGAIDGAKINVTDTDIDDSTYEAVQFVSGKVDGVSLDGVNIKNTGTFALQYNDPGETSFKNVKAEGIGFTKNAVYACSKPTINDNGGNSGWNDKLPDTYCGDWPSPAKAK